MAALNAVQGAISLAFNFSAAVDSEKRATYQKMINKALSFSTGTGTSGSAVDMVYVDELQVAASTSATAIDLSALSQAGNSMNVAKPKYIMVFYISGDGTFFLDSGATNGYTGFPAIGASISANRPFLCWPCTVATGGSDKTLDYSETAAAAVTVLLCVVGSSA